MNDDANVFNDFWISHVVSHQGQAEKVSEVFAAYREFGGEMPYEEFFKRSKLVCRRVGWRPRKDGEPWFLDIKLHALERIGV